MGSDHLTAKFDGSKVIGDVTEHAAGDARATWVVQPDGHMVGMMVPNSKRDREVIGRINKQQQEFKGYTRF